MLYKFLKAQDFGDAYKSQDAIFLTAQWEKQTEIILLSRNCAVKTGFELHCLKFRFN